VFLRFGLEKRSGRRSGLDAEGYGSVQQPLAFEKAAKCRSKLAVNVQLRVALVYGVRRLRECSRWLVFCARLTRRFG